MGQAKFKSIDFIREQLMVHRYVNDDSLAAIINLSYHLDKPMFLEGEPGGGPKLRWCFRRSLPPDSSGSNATKV